MFTSLSIDTTTTLFLISHRSDQGVAFFRLITEFASPVAGCLAVILLGYYFYRHHKWQLGLMNLYGFLSAEGITWALKHLIRRERPSIILRAVTENSFSFPSGHATTAAFLFGLIGYLACTHIRTTWGRSLIIGAVIFGIVLIDLSRLYLGVHYLSDVLFGNVIGLGILFLTLRVDRIMAAKNGR